MKDPALLFNRGECYRRIEDKEHALADYRRFLQEVPDAPTGCVVASRALSASGQGARAAASRAGSGSQRRFTHTVAAGAYRKHPETGAGGWDTATQPSTLRPKPKFADPQIVMVGNEPQQPAKEADKGVTGQWWFWTAVGAVLIGGGVAGYFILNPKTEIPSSHLGNYIF